MQGSCAATKPQLSCMNEHKNSAKPKSPANRVISFCTISCKRLQGTVHWYYRHEVSSVRDSVWLRTLSTDSRFTNRFCLQQGKLKKPFAALQCNTSQSQTPSKSTVQPYASCAHLVVSTVRRVGDQNLRCAGLGPLPWPSESLQLRQLTLGRGMSCGQVGAAASHFVSSSRGRRESCLTGFESKSLGRGLPSRDPGLLLVLRKLAFSCGSVNQSQLLHRGMSNP